MPAVIAVFFLGSMMLLILGLILFPIEVSISTRSIGHGITEILDEEKTALTDSSFLISLTSLPSSVSLSPLQSLYRHLGFSTLGLENRSQLPSR